MDSIDSDMYNLSYLSAVVVGFSSMPSYENEEGSMRSKTFTKWAFANGRREHKFYNVLGITLILSSGYFLLIDERIYLYLSLINLLVYGIAKGSHHLEKFCFKHGNFKPRG